MKAKRAIEKLRNLKRSKVVWADSYKVLDAAISALEKQIPMEPKDVSEEVYDSPGARYECPSCGAYLGRIQFNGKKGYCLYCGQAMRLKER